MTADIIVKRKVFAYITHRRRLLLFRHTNFPEAGIQVPAGTLEPGESPASGVIREAREETGLADLELVRFLGETVHSMHEHPGSFPPHERHHRFFHLTCLGEPPPTWRSYRPDRVRVLLGRAARRCAAADRGSRSVHFEAGEL